MDICVRGIIISIHPPREGWDDRYLWPVGYQTDFNPPTP